MTDIRKLLYKVSIHRTTEADRDELREWAADDSMRNRLIERLSDPEYVAGQLRRRATVSVERPSADMKRRINAIRLREKGKIYAYAACAVLVLAIGASLFLPEDGDKALDTHTGMRQESLMAKTNSLDEIVAGTTKATLITDGETVVMLDASDTAVSGFHSTRGAGVARGEKATRLCLDVPRGGEFKIVLEDGTEVWLNSDSRLRYPQVFDESERRVSVEGEAYFVVKKDASRPFYVDTEDMTVKVYGTSFNVKAYGDEEFACATLEKGSVAITAKKRPSGELLLSPGHQALLSREDHKINMKVVDPSEIAAWHNGRFVLEAKSLKEIMRDLSRWYDFKYRFDDKSLEDIIFMGSIPRYENFSSAQHILEQSGDIRLRMEGDCVVISEK